MQFKVGDKARVKQVSIEELKREGLDTENISGQVVDVISSNSKTVIIRTSTDYRWFVPIEWLEPIAPPQAQTIEELIEENRSLSEQIDKLTTRLRRKKQFYNDNTETINKRLGCMTRYPL